MLPAAYAACVRGVGSLLAAVLPLCEMNSLQEQMVHFGVWYWIDSAQL